VASSIPPPDPAVVDGTTGPLRVGAPVPRPSLRPAALGLLALALAASLAFLPRATPSRALPLRGLTLALPTLHIAAPAPSTRPARPAPAVRGSEPGQRRQRRGAGR
jgi:hypothetical protein